FCIFLYTPLSAFFISFFFNDPTPTEIYTLSLHDALPISLIALATFCTVFSWLERMITSSPLVGGSVIPSFCCAACRASAPDHARSEEHTSELQSRRDLVCRLLLEKKKKKKMK